MARMITAKMHRMFALVHRLGVRGRELWPQGIRSRNIQADRFTLFVLQAHEPYSDLQFDDLSPGYELDSIVRVKRVVGMDRSRRIDVTVRGTQTPDGSVVRDQSVARGIFRIINRGTGEGDSQVNQGVSLNIQFPELQEQAHVVQLVARDVDHCLGQAD